MGRSSRRDAQLHREEVVEAASHLFRERGLDGVSVPELMGAAGLTHGGFYRHFDSKDALAALACSAAFETQLAAIRQLPPQDALGAFLDDYLSAPHRDDAADGCPTTAFAADVGRAAADSPVRDAYADGVSAFADAIRTLQGTGEDDDAGRQQALTTLATMVGALTLARATKGNPVSDELLDAARHALGARGSGS
jgi:TetR/AcrR family transcriptional repressor of nem operon